MNQEVVRIDGLSKKFGDHVVLNNINLSLTKGRIYGFIGQNGAGKTTLINHINGLMYPTSGSLSLFGVSDEKELIEARKRIGTVSEHAGLHDNYNAYDNVRYNMMLRGISGEDVIVQTINSVGLNGVGKKKFRNYSMGMKQRLAIGCAMLSGPELLLLDEPINGLDPVGIVEIRNLLKQINQQYGVTILISSHILTELHELATDYIIIDRGNIIDCVSAQELDARCLRQLCIRTSEPEKVIAILNNEYNIYNIGVSQNNIVVNEQINSDEFAWRLYNEHIFFSEFYVKEENLENYFIKLLGGGIHG